MTALDGQRPVRALLCVGLLLGLPLLLRAEQPPAKSVEPADADLIEFLGSVDSDDVGWKQYLARTGARPAPKKPPAAPPSSSAPGKDSGTVEH
jgi:hypothetical protein